MKDILDVVYLWTYKKLLTKWIMKYCLLSKFDHYGIQGISNNWFNSYLSNRKQFSSINGYDSGIAEINCGVPQGFVLGPPLFLLYLNDINEAITFYK